MNYLSVNRDLLIEELRNDVFEIRFEKKDGSIRTMNATLDPEWLPEITDDKEPSNRKVNENVVVVWDIELKDWRSFRLDRVLSINDYDFEIDEVA